MELGLTLGGGEVAGASTKPPINKATDLALVVNSGESETQDPHRLHFDLLPLAEEVSSPNSAASAGGVEEQAERTSLRTSDEDENGHTRKKLRLSKEQSAFLEDNFKEHHTLNPKQKQELAKQLNLMPRQVEVWFQNRRARTKLKQTEVDCEYLKRCCETLSEENKRLHNELQELRALKSFNPYYMQHPATTITMCPSCERTNTTIILATSSASVTTTATTISANTAIDPSSIATPSPLSTPKSFPFASKNN